MKNIVTTLLLLLLATSLLAAVRKGGKAKATRKRKAGAGKNQRFRKPTLKPKAGINKNQVAIPESKKGNLEKSVESKFIKVIKVCKRRFHNKQM